MRVRNERERNRNITSAVRKVKSEETKPSGESVNILACPSHESQESVGRELRSFFPKCAHGLSSPSIFAVTKWATTPTVAFVPWPLNIPAGGSAR